MDLGAPWLVALAGVLAGSSLPRFWAPTEVRPEVRVVHAAAECSCDAELRQLLESRDQVEWYRLACFLLLFIAGLLSVLACLGLSCLCGWCACCTQSVGRARSPPPGPSSARAGAVPVTSLSGRSSSELLAILAQNEVRR